MQTQVVRQFDVTVIGQETQHGLTAPEMVAELARLEQWGVDGLQVLVTVHVVT